MLEFAWIMRAFFSMMIFQANLWIVIHKIAVSLLIKSILIIILFLRLASWKSIYESSWMIISLGHMMTILIICILRMIKSAMTLCFFPTIQTISTGYNICLIVTMISKAIRIHSLWWIKSFEIIYYDIIRIIKFDI